MTDTLIEVKFRFSPAEKELEEMVFLVIENLIRAAGRGYCRVSNERSETAAYRP